MGGRPISALTLVCFPDSGDPKVLEEMLAGGLSKMIEAGCTVIGGHSIRDDEIKLGYSVTGTIHPQKILANGGAQPGDRLSSPKPSAPASSPPPSNAARPTSPGFAPRSIP